MWFILAGLHFGLLVYFRDYLITQTARLIVSALDPQDSHSVWILQVNHRPLESQLWTAISKTLLEVTLHFLYFSVKECTRHGSDTEHWALLSWLNPLNCDSRPWRSATDFAGAVISQYDSPRIASSLLFTLAKWLNYRSVERKHI